jgi:hypothetical protein
MWNYSRKLDPARISKEDLSTNELEKHARSFIKKTNKLKFHPLVGLYLLTRSIR